jgi:hypothetical protein
VAYTRSGGGQRVELGRIVGTGQVEVGVVDAELAQRRRQGAPRGRVDLGEPLERQPSGIAPGPSMAPRW